jgi:hypothetical protein
MKWIFLSLLLSNIVYFGYQQMPLDELSPSSVSLLEQERETLELLSDRSRKSEREREVEEVLGNPLDTYVENDVLCLALGPFDNVVSAQDVSERLVARGLPISLRAVDHRTGEFDYRVVMPPLPSLQEAFRKLRELKSRDIDSYVITEGVDAQGISLGVFSTLVSAEERLASLGLRGYTVVVKELPRVSRGYWVFNTGADLPAQLLNEINLEFPGVSIDKTACLN